MIAPAPSEAMWDRCSNAGWAAPEGGQAPETKVPAVVGAAVVDEYDPEDLPYTGRILTCTTCDFTSNSRNPLYKCHRLSRGKSAALTPRL